MSVGRPSKYNPSFDEQAYKLCLLGATDNDLADFFEVNQDTINEWKKVHPSFSESLKRGKSIADSNVADRLYQRAMGFEHDTEEIKVLSAGKEGSIIERVPIRKIYPPDSVAAIFWLKNRQPDKWREKQEIDKRTRITDERIDTSNLTEEDLRVLAEIQRKSGAGQKEPK